MKVFLTKLPKSKIELVFEISWEELQFYLDKAVYQLNHNFQKNGFRKGKAPRDILENELGKDKILARGAELAIKKEYHDYVIKKRIEVIGIPKCKILKLAPGNPLNFKIETEVLPKIQLPDYRKLALEVEKREISVKKEEVDETLKWIQKSRLEFKNVFREAKEGDFLEIEYFSPQIEKGKIYQDKFFLGKGHFVPGFEENLKGMKPNEEKEFQLQVPTDYFKKEIAGRKITFKIKLKRVQETNVPQINDEFARKIGKFKDLENLKKSIREGIFLEKKFQEKERRRNEILEKIAKKIDFQIPETLVALEKERMLNELKENIKKTLKISFQEYLRQIKKTVQELKNSFSCFAYQRVKKFLILREIGKKEKIEVKEEEVEQVINEVLKNYPSREKVEQEIDLERLKEYYKSRIYNEKIFQLLENL